MISFIILNLTLILSSLIFYLFHKKTFFKSIVLYDNPDNLRKLHKNPVPLISGIIILQFLILNLMLEYLNNNIGLKILIILISLYILFFFVGFFDDKTQILPLIRSFIIISLLFLFLPLDETLVVKNIFIEKYNLNINLNQGAIFFSVLCVYFFYNFFNFIDGTNGVAITVALFWLAFNYLNGAFLQNITLSIFLCLSFLLILNLKGKIFLGNCGTSLLSIFISILFITNYNKSFIEVDEIFLVMFLPFIDSIRVTINRIIKNKSPFVGDRNHLHHLLEGFCSEKYIFVFYLVLTMLPYLSSLYIKSVISLSFSIFFYFLLIFILKNFKKKFNK